MLLLYGLRLVSHRLFLLELFAYLSLQRRDLFLPLDKCNFILRLDRLILHLQSVVLGIQTLKGVR